MSRGDLHVKQEAILENVAPVGQTDMKLQELCLGAEVVGMGKVVNANGGGEGMMNTLVLNIFLAVTVAIKT